MYLHGHPSPGFRFCQPGVNSDHGAFDDIRRTALHRCINSGAFRCLATLEVAGFDFGQVKPPAEDCFDIALF